MFEQSHHEVTGQERESESVLHRSEVQFRRLLEKLPAGAYTCDSKGLITYFNQHAAQLWGRVPKLNDPVDRFCGSFKLFAADGSPIMHDQCWMAMALRMNSEYNGNEIIVERPDGKRLTVLAYANPIHDDAGRLLGAVNVLVDISERKHTEDVLKEADRAKNEFLATLAHELRNPLAPISTAVELLHLEGPSSPESQWALDVIDRQVQQMTRLIDDLLDLARITSGKLELRKDRVELAAVLHAAVETSRPFIESCGNTFDVTIPQGSILLDGDPIRLAQVISNLLNNAAKYTPRGGHIWLTAEQQGSDAIISVRDTGVGISAEMLPRIFEMFTQVDRSLNRSQGGLGIGLTLARRLVNMHGGSITVRSDGPDRGSEFIVRLPVLIDSSPALHQVDAINGKSRPTSVPLALRILVVDDNHDSADSLGMMLRIMGNEIRTAHDGSESVQVADAFRPDVILLDIGLPELNGYDVARSIRQQTWGREIVLIAVTGWGQEADRDRSREAGFDHHLVKPVDPASLVQLLEQAVSNSGRSSD